MVQRSSDNYPFDWFRLGGWPRRQTAGSPASSACYYPTQFSEWSSHAATCAIIQARAITRVQCQRATWRDSLVSFRSFDALNEWMSPWMGLYRGRIREGLLADTWHSRLQYHWLEQPAQTNWATRSLHPWHLGTSPPPLKDPDPAELVIRLPVDAGPVLAIRPETEPPWKRMEKIDQSIN